MIFHPIQSMRCTRLGSLIIVFVTIGGGLSWGLTNVFLSWLLTGKHTWLYRFDQPWPGRVVPIAMWTFWMLGPFLAIGPGVDWKIITKRTARQIVTAFGAFTVIGLVYLNTFAITPQCRHAVLHDNADTAQSEAAFNAACAKPLKGTR